MDNTLHPRLEAAELNAENLVGAKIYDTNDRTVGTISHLHGHSGDAQVVVDVGGFLGIGATPVALRLDQLDIMRDGNGVVHAITRMTRAQVEDLPEHHH
jgi:hypothetical protein